MSKVKMITLCVYAVLAALAAGVAGGSVANGSQMIIGVLVVVHAIEMVVFFKACSNADGSLGGHLLNVFFFGVLHMREIKSRS